MTRRLRARDLAQPALPIALASRDVPLDDPPPLFTPPTHDSIAERLALDLRSEFQDTPGPMPVWFLTRLVRFAEQCRGSGGLRRALKNYASMSLPDRFRPRINNDPEGERKTWITRHRRGLVILQRIERLSIREPAAPVLVLADWLFENDRKRFALGLRREAPADEVSISIRWALNVGRSTTADPILVELIGEAFGWTGRPMSSRLDAQLDEEIQRGNL